MKGSKEGNRTGKNLTEGVLNDSKRHLSKAVVELERRLREEEKKNAKLSKQSSDRERYR